MVGFERDFANPFGGTFGTIWFEGQGVQDLTAFATASGVPLPPGLQLTIPLAISADGTTIAGLDSFFGGFVVVIPEPSGIVLAAPVLIMLLRRRSR